MSDEPQKWVCTNKDCEHFGEDVVAEGATRVYCVSCREDLALQATVPEGSAKAAKPVSDSLLLEDERRIEEPKSWRCFHCDEVFTDEAEANDHFGEYTLCVPNEPLCVSPLRNDEKARLKELRDAQRYVGQMREESQQHEERADDLAVNRADDLRQIAKTFGDDCTSVWLACDRYNNTKFERDDLLSRLKAEREKNEKLMLGLDSALRDLDFDSPHLAKRTLNELLRAAAKESHE